MDDPAVRTMNPPAHRQWLMLLDAQFGIVDRSQAKQAGLSDRQIWAVAVGCFVGGGS
jgi:hypothetical protein